MQTAKMSLGGREQRTMETGLGGKNLGLISYAGPWRRLLNFQFVSLMGWCKKITDVYTQGICINRCSLLTPGDFTLQLPPRVSGQSTEILYAKQLSWFLNDQKNCLRRGREASEECRDCWKSILPRRGPSVNVSLSTWVSFIVGETGEKHTGFV